MEPDIPVEDDTLDLTIVTPSETESIEETLIENVNAKIDEVNVEVTEVADEEEADNEEEVREELAEETPSDEGEVTAEITSSDVDDPENYSNAVEFPTGDDLSEEDFNFGTEGFFDFFKKNKTKKHPKRAKVEEAIKAVKGKYTSLAKVITAGFQEKEKQNKQGSEAFQLGRFLLYILACCFIIPAIIWIIWCIVTWNNLSKDKASLKKAANKLLDVELKDTIEEYFKAKSKDHRRALRAIFKQQWNSLNGIIKDLKELGKTYGKKLAFDDEATGYTDGEVNTIMNHPTYRKAERLEEELMKGKEDFQMTFRIDKNEFNKMVYGNENIGLTLFPLSPTKLDALKIPSKKALTNIFIKGEENLKDYIDARFTQIDEICAIEQDEELTKKVNDYKKIATEALDTAYLQKNALNTLGIAPWGLADTDDPVALKVGVRLYKIANGNSKIAGERSSLKCNSVEDAVDRIFDLKLIKNKFNSLSKSKSNASLGVALYETYKAREEYFWDNIIKFEEADKEKITKIFQLSELDIDKDALIKDDFLTSLQLSIDNITTRTKGTDGKVEGEFDKKVYDAAVNKVKEYLNRDLTDEETSIIKATCENTDSDAYIPTLFEKFVIKLGKDNINDDFELNGGDTSKEDLAVNVTAKEITNKASCLTTMYEFVNRMNILSGDKLNEFNKHVLGGVL